MENEERESLITFLAMFQGGGEPIKDILSRMPVNDLIEKVLFPMLVLVARIGDYALEAIPDDFEAVKMSRHQLKALLASDSVSKILEYHFSQLNGGYEFISINSDPFLMLCLRLIGE